MFLTNHKFRTCLKNRRKLKKIPILKFLFPFLDMYKKKKGPVETSKTLKAPCILKTKENKPNQFCVDISYTY